MESLAYVRTGRARTPVPSVQQPWKSQSPIRLLAAVVVAAAEVEVEVTVPVPAEVAVRVPVLNEAAVLLELVGTGREVLSMYMLSLFGPPQYSLLLPLQAMLQSAARAGTAPAPRVLPHQHSPPYSTPIQVYFLAAQAVMQLPTV